MQEFYTYIKFLFYFCLACKKGKPLALDGAKQPHSTITIWSTPHAFASCSIGLIQESIPVSSEAKLAVPRFLKRQETKKHEVRNTSVDLIMLWKLRLHHNHPLHTGQPTRTSVKHGTRQCGGETLR